MAERVTRGWSRLHGRWPSIRSGRVVASCSHGCRPNRDAAKRYSDCTLSGFADFFSPRQKGNFCNQWSGGDRPREFELKMRTIVFMFLPLADWVNCFSRCERCKFFFIDRYSRNKVSGGTRYESLRRFIKVFIAWSGGLSSLFYYLLFVIGSKSYIGYYKLRISKKRATQERWNT